MVLQRAVMICTSFRHITFCEITSRTAFVLISAILGASGARFASAQVPFALLAIWVTLFLAIYRIRCRAFVRVGNVRVASKLS